MLPGWLGILLCVGISWLTWWYIPVSLVGGFVGRRDSSSKQNVMRWESCISNGSAENTDEPISQNHKLVICLLILKLPLMCFISAIEWLTNYEFPELLFLNHFSPHSYVTPSFFGGNGFHSQLGSRVCFYLLTWSSFSPQEVPSPWQVGLSSHLY